MSTVVNPLPATVVRPKEPRSRDLAITQNSRPGGSRDGVTLRLETRAGMDNRDMTRETRFPARHNMAAALRRVLDRIRNWRRRSPPPAGVREPRRPKPGLPAAAVALKEPRVRTRWIRLVSRRGDDQT